MEKDKLIIELQELVYKTAINFIQEHDLSVDCVTVFIIMPTEELAIKAWNTRALKEISDKEFIKDFFQMFPNLIMYNNDATKNIKFWLHANLKAKFGQPKGEVEEIKNE